MTSVRQMVKNALMSNDERLVRKYNVVNEDGSVNARGRVIYMDAVLSDATERQVLIDRLQAIEDSEKAEAKKSKKG